MNEWIFLKGTEKEVEKKLNELERGYYLTVMNPVVLDGKVCLLVAKVNPRPIAQSK